MCGRFISISEKNKVKKIFDIKKINNFTEKSYNICPKQKINLIFIENGNLTLDSLEWGYSFHNKITNKNQLIINSRIETINTKLIFKESYLKRKCIVLSNGYIEWKHTTKDKLPYFINIPEKELFFIGAIWRLEKINNTFTSVCCLITKKANNEIKHIHERMPVIFSPKEAINFLNDDKNEYSETLIKSEIEDELDFFQISKTINNPKNNNKACLFPLNKL